MEHIHILGRDDHNEYTNNNNSETSVVEELRGREALTAADGSNKVEMGNGMRMRSGKYVCTYVHM